MSRMFPFITKTWNPLGGECLHHCSYCWAKQLIKKYDMQKYTGKPYIIDKEMARQFKETDYVFVCDMTDLFGQWVPKELIQRILDHLQKRVNANSHAKFLLLTKNPARYLEFKIPDNCVCGATIESDIDHQLTGSPETSRLAAMAELDHEKMISIEPIMTFDPERFPLWIAKVNPDFVAVGYDNYKCGLIEPSLHDTIRLVRLLEDSGIKVYRKTLREPLLNAGENTNAKTN